MTFGNIGGGESPVAGVHAIKADIKEIDESSETPTAQEEVPGSSAEVMVARCVIESTCFDAPAGYREVNLDQPVGECKRWMRTFIFSRCTICIGHQVVNSFNDQTCSTISSQFIW